MTYSRLESSGMQNLDTHILIHAVSGLLTQAERKVLAAAAWGLSDIVLWEIEMLYARRRIGFGLDHPPLIETLRRVKIAATSLAHDVPLVTRDARIRSSKLVRFSS